LNKSTEPQPVFEACLRELEETVERLEAGDLPLEESLALFEKGVGALKRCHALLDQAEKRVRILVRGVNGEPELRDATALPLSSENPPAKNSVQQNVDSGGVKRQNTRPFTENTQVPEIDQERSPAENGPGGSLFGESQ
jgi:exodeoxyribonuclease VII small subunit